MPCCFIGVGWDCGCWRAGLAIRPFELAGAALAQLFRPFGLHDRMLSGDAKKQIETTEDFRIVYKAKAGVAIFFRYRGNTEVQAPRCVAKVSNPDPAPGRLCVRARCVRGLPDVQWGNAEPALGTGPAALRTVQR